MDILEPFIQGKTGDSLRATVLRPTISDGRFI
jgi:hypothetical protein